MTVIIYLYFIAGILWHLLPVTKPLVIGITPYGLIILPLLIFYFDRSQINRNTILWLILIFVLTIVLEIIGVETGLIFGSYYYKNILGIKVWGVPLVIGINWMMIIYGLYSVTRKYLKLNIILQSLIIGCSAVLFDFFLEPVAIELNYWEWNSVIVPLSNYISWFVLAFIFAFTGYLFKAKKGSNLVIHFLFAQFIFFVLLSIYL